MSCFTRSSQNTPQWRRRAQCSSTWLCSHPRLVSVAWDDVFSGDWNPGLPGQGVAAADPSTCGHVVATGRASRLSGSPCAGVGIGRAPQGSAGPRGKGPARALHSGVRPAASVRPALGVQQLAGQGCPVGTQLPCPVGSSHYHRAAL